jgi:hypothetical protein
MIMPNMIFPGMQYPYLPGINFIFSLLPVIDVKKKRLSVQRVLNRFHVWINCVLILL